MNISFVGGMCIGKTTHARLLMQNAYGFTRISLADPIREVESKLDSAETLFDLRDIAVECLGPAGYNDDAIYTFTDVLYEAKHMPRETPKPRSRLQYIGTEGGRNKIDPDIWIKILRARIHLPENADKNWVMDDVRFVNEYTSLLGLFIPIKLILPTEVQLARINMLYPGLDVDKALAHQSETDSQQIILPSDMTFDTQDPIEVVHERILKRIFK